MIYYYIRRNTLINVAITFGILGLMGFLLIGRRGGAAGLGGNPFVSSPDVFVTILI